MRPRLWTVVAAAALLASPLASSLPSIAGTADVTGTLTVFIGDGSGIPVTGSALPGSAAGVSFSSSGTAFTLPAGIFTTLFTTPVGWSASAGSGSIYTIRTVTSSSNTAGSFAKSSGSWTGIMGSGTSFSAELGVVPLPMVFGSLFIPLNVGSPGTSTASVVILGNALTVTLIATGWTTGQVTISDQTASGPTGTFVSSAMATGNDGLTPNGGSISLVTPFLVRIRGSGVNENRAGFATLSLSFTNKVPEPAALALLALGGGVFLAGRLRHRLGGQAGRAKAPDQPRATRNR